MSVTLRYSDEELALFKIRIEQKLEKASSDLAFLMEQVQDITDAKEDDGDLMDDVSYNNDLEMLYTMVNRHQRHIRDLENALLRIRNKSYGICMVTGELIDKRRLMAVLTTTKSLAAKMVSAEAPKAPRLRPRPITNGKVTEKRIVTKAPVKNPLLKTEEFFDEEDDFFKTDFGSDLEYDESIDSIDSILLD